MARPVVFYAFSFHSPYSALADSRIDALVRDAGGVLEPWPLVPPRPPPPEGVQALVAGFRWEYIDEDAARWASDLGLAWSPPPPPVVFGDAKRSSAAWFFARENEQEAEFRNRVFRARFGSGLDTEDPDVLAECAWDVGLRPEALVEAALSDSYQALAPASLERMAAKKVFGVPFFSVEGARFFGNDRLDFLRRHLDGLAQGTP